MMEQGKLKREKRKMIREEVADAIKNGKVEGRRNKGEEEWKGRGQ